MRTRSRVLACFVLTLAATTAGRGAPAQEPQEPSPPVFRVETNFIRVDMYATRDGAFVTDLRPDEVLILEDGVRQEIETFEYVHVPDLAPAPAEDAGEIDGRSRVFVIFIDTHTTELIGDARMRLSLLRFLDRLLRPDDLVALMTPETPVSAVTLENRSRIISDIANDVRFLEEDGDGRTDLTEFAWENCYARGGSGRLLQEMKARRNATFTINALHNLVWHLRSLREERKAVLFITGGWPFVSEYTLEGRRGATETDDCVEDRSALAGIDYKDLLKEVTEAANRANVSFYPVSSRQPFVAPPRARGDMVQRMRQRDTRARNAIRDQLQLLADKTDGLADLEGDFSTVADRIIADTSSYYLIGYQSTNTNTDGRFRNITVRVTRPGVRVRARSGYGGDAPAPRMTEEPSRLPPGPTVDPRVADALTPVQRFDTLAPFWGRMSSLDVGEGGAFWFIGELGLEARTRAPWRNGATADVTVFDGNRTPVLTQTFTIAPDEGAFMVRVPSDGRATAGDYSVRVRLRGAGEEFASVQEVANVTLGGGEPTLGEAVLWRRGSSILLDYLLTADPRFRRTERMRLELPTASPAPATARLLDRFGQPLPVALDVTDRPDGSDDFRWLVVEPPLIALAPAYYTIEVAQDGVSQFTSFQLIP